MADFADTPLSNLRQLNAPLGWAAFYSATGFLAAALQQNPGNYLWHPRSRSASPACIAPICAFGRCCPWRISSSRSTGHGGEALATATSNMVAIGGAALALRTVRERFEVVDHRDFGWLALASSLMAVSLGSALVYALNGGDAPAAWTAWFGWWLSDMVCEFNPEPIDVNQICHDLTRLIASEIKFTDSGGSVVLTAEPADDAQVALLIIDNGRGIPRERIAELCRPFVQIADPLRRDVGGIGLGLAISHSLAEAMGGTLTIDSDIGKGTIVGGPGDA